MAEPPNLTQIAFSGGIDESIEGEILDPTKSYRRLENCRQSHVGGMQKRLGFSAVTSLRVGGAIRGSGKRMIQNSAGGALVLDQASTLDEYSESANANVNYGVASECTLTKLFVPTRILNSTTTDTVSDVTFANRYYAIAESSGGFGYLSVVDANGVVIRAPELIFTTAATIVLLGAYSSFLLAVGVADGQANVPAYYLDTSNFVTLAAGWQFIGNVGTDHNTSIGNDICFAVQSLSDRVVVAYRNTAGTGMTVRAFTISGSVNVTTVTGVPNGSIAMGTSPSGALWVTWDESSGVVKAIGLTPTNLTVTLSSVGSLLVLDVPFARSLGIVWFDGSASGKIIASELTKDRCQSRTFNTVAGVTTAVSAQFRTPTTQLVGKPFTMGSRCYAVFDAYTNNSNGSPDQSGQQHLGVVCDWTDNRTWWRPVAMSHPFLANYGTLSSAQCCPISATQFTTVLAVQRNAVAQGIALVTYDFAPSIKRGAASISDSLYLDGGIISTFDGIRITELGFIPRPAPPLLAVGSAGSLIGTYNYVCTLECVDADGRLVQSSVSDPGLDGSGNISLTVSGKIITVTYRPCGITNRNVTGTPGSEVRIVLWRTTGAGIPPYYFVTSFDNNTTNVFVAYSDNLSDTSLVNNRLLMGTGSLPGTGAQQDRRAPAGLRNLVNYNGMLVGSIGSQIFYSSQTIDGEEPWFNPLFTVTVPEDVIALYPLDGTLYVLCRRSIYAAVGDPPTDNGAQNGLGNPRLLASDAGCIDAGSVVGGGLGIFFQSVRGIELLGRDGSVQWIGQPVQKTLALFPFVTSATLDTSNTLIRFTLATTRTNGVVAAAGGCSVVYNPSLSNWASKDLIQGQIAGEAAQDACMLLLGGIWRYSWLGQDGHLYIEHAPTDVDAYLDGATWITRVCETGDFKVSGLQGQQMFNGAMLLERLVSGHDVSISSAYDYSTSYETPTVYTAATINALLAAGWPITQLKQLGSNNAQGQAVRLLISDATPSSGAVGSGQASTWLGLTLDITPQTGAMEVPDTAT